jgi:hypothetical protein
MRKEIYKCSKCGWEGEEKDVFWYALEEENVDCCPRCYDEREEIIFLDWSYEDETK